MKNRTIYRKIIVFSLPRVPFYILGCFLAVVFEVICLLIGAFVPPVRDFMSVLGVIGLIIIVIYVTGYGARVYKAAQVGLITTAINTGRLPKKIFASGMKMVDVFFEISTIGGIVIHTANVTIDRSFRKMTRKEILNKNGHSLKDELRSLIIFYGCSLIPYIGYCVESYVFSHPELSMVEAVVEGTKKFFKNFHRMIFTIIRVFITQILFVTFIGSVVLIPIYSEIQKHDKLAGVLAESAERAYDVTGEAALIAAVVLTAAVVLIINSFAQPRAMISVIRKYLEVCDDATIKVLKRESAESNKSETDRNKTNQNETEKEVTNGREIENV